MNGRATIDYTLSYRAEDLHCLLQNGHLCPAVALENSDSRRVVNGGRRVSSEERREALSETEIQKKEII